MDSLQQRADFDLSIEKNLKIENFILIPGVAGAGLEDFRGTPENRRRVGRVEVASLARGGSGSDRRAGSHPYVAPFYEKKSIEKGSWKLST